MRFTKLFLPALLLACSCFTAVAEEHIGVVDFPVSCSASVQASFNRGVAVLHSFWYEESEAQFTAIAKQDPQCAMAHWGIAMSIFHQIWDRPDPATNAKGWKEMQQAQTLLAKDPSATPREQAYVAALNAFYKPAKDAAKNAEKSAENSAKNDKYETRIADYSAAMGKLHADFPADVDAAGFYALSLMAASSPDDLSLASNRAAMVVLTPLFTQYPHHPGVQHYIIHACDTPALANDGLAAAERYEQTAASVPHGVHMPGHIYARLGMWQDDIRANRASVADSQLAEKQKQGGVYDQLHSDDFLMYAYLQSADDAAAQSLLQGNTVLTDHLSAMAKAGNGGMAEMIPYFRVKLPVFYNLEMRDWNAALAFHTPDEMPGMKMMAAMNTMMIDWAKVIAAGHLQKPADARAAMASWQKSVDGLRKTPSAFMVESASTRIEKSEMEAWVAFAAGDRKTAFATMRTAADEQDKVGQGEVDIPAREMLGDMLLDAKQPQEALAAYQAALKLSPGRLNGLYHAGLAAEAVGKPSVAAQYYAVLLKNTGDGKQSTRPEFSHAKTFLAGIPTASSQAD